MHLNMEARFEAIYIKNRCNKQRAHSKIDTKYFTIYTVLVILFTFLYFNRLA
jgi:hypothetical protein